jgi:hypothetical protein
MVRVRFYGFVLSLPIILMVGSVVAAFVMSGPDSFKTVMIIFGAGFALQVLFSLAFACPQCGKSPYAIGPSIGPFAVAGKPIPDVKCSRCGYHFVSEKSASLKPEQHPGGRAR